MSSKPGYKQTEIGEIPEDWDLLELGNGHVCIDITDGFHNTPKKAPNGIALIKVENIYDDKIHFDNVDKISIEEHRKEMKRCHPQDKDVLLTCVGTLGRTAVVETQEEFNIVRSVALLRPATRINSYFLAYLLHLSMTKYQMEALQTSTTRKGLYLESIRKIKIPVPRKIEEQQKIVAILWSVDQQIKITQMRIHGNQKIKKALMQKLLTKGIRHTRFKQTEIGEIPEQWNIDELGKIVDVIKRGPSQATNNEKKGIGYITSDCIDDNNILNFNSIKYLDELLIDDKNKYYIKSNDIIINCVNSPEKIGKVAMYEGNDDKYIIGFNNFALTINHNINPHCVKYILMLSEISQQIKKKLKPAVFQVSFSSSDLLSIIIPLPNTRFEQDYIVSILSNVDAKIENDLHIIQELDSLKKGLMSDLLTGRLRVKVN